MNLNPFRFLQRPPKPGGRKANMPDLLSTPPASPAKSDDRLSALLDAVSQLAEQQKSLLAAIKPAAGATQPAASAGDRIDRTLLAELLGVSLDRSGALDRGVRREAFIRANLADLPEAYQRLMPQTDDPAKLATGEVDVRRRFREDLKEIFDADARRLATPGTPRSKSAGVAASAGTSSGVSTPADGSAVDAASPDEDDDVFTPARFRNVGGDAPGGRPVSAAIDYSKLSPLQQITVGLKGKASAPARVAPAAPARVTPADAPADEVFVGAD